MSDRLTEEEILRLYPTKGYRVIFHFADGSEHHDDTDYLDYETAADYAMIEGVLAELCFQETGKRLFQIVDFEILEIVLSTIH